MYVCGCDLGSTTGKAVIMKNDTIAARSVVKSTRSPEMTAHQAMEEALGLAGLSSFADLRYIVGTGYGRMGVSFINENIFSLSPNIFVDPKIAKIGENGEITPKFEEGWKILLPISEEAPSPPLSLDQLLDLDPDPDPLLKKLINLNSNVVAKHIPLCKPKEGDIPIEEDGVPLIFRGIDYKLMQKFIINGETKSGEVEQGLPQLDKSYELFFGDDPETAFAYAAWGSGYSQPTFEQPSYVFSIKMPDSDISRPSKHEVVLNTQKGGLRLEDIIHIYEIRPYKITSGLGIPLQISHDKKAMCMEEGWGNVSLAPRTFSVYREVKVEDTQ